MEFEVLKKSHLKRNIIIGVLVVAVISAIVLNFTRAKYRTTQSIPLVNGTINYTPYDLNTIAMYQENNSGEYESIDTVPESGYQLNEEQSYCEVNGEEDTSIRVSYNTDTRSLSISPMTTKGTKCYLYFDAVKTLSNAILAGKDIQERSSFSNVLSTNTNGIIYQEQTSDGTTYYFAGDTDENWVSFAGYYWRIIRINEDGSIRMIYNGTTTDQTGTGTQLQTSAYNRSYNDNAYVGYMYGTTGASSYSATHTNTNDSTIKGILDDWYYDHIYNTGYEDLISTEAGFCGDRTRSTSSSSLNNSGGTGTTQTYYGAYIRLRTNKTPTLECENESDLYTTSGSSDGNKALTYPIGLITADELAYAGGVWATNNTSYYLYTNLYNWTMSPSYYSGGAAVFYVNAYGTLGYGNDGVSRTWGVRPVINLKTDVTISDGDGSSSDPFVVV